MLNSPTHCQVAQANAQTKIWQRVCLFQPATDRQTGRKNNTERTILRLPVVGTTQQGSVG